MRFELMPLDIESRSNRRLQYRLTCPDQELNLEPSAFQWRTLYQLSYQSIVLGAGTGFEPVLSAHEAGLLPLKYPA